MIERKIVFRAKDSLSSDLAADLAQHAAKYKADVRFAVGAFDVPADSLIAVLALPLHRGETLTIKAEGPDAEAVVQELADLLANE